MDGSNLNHDDWWGYLPARVEAEGDGDLVRHLLRETSGNHLRQGLLLGLGLSCQFSASVTKPRDVVLK